MNTTPTPRPGPSSLPLSAADRHKLIAWLRLKRDVAELHARLEYLKLMITLGVRRHDR